MKITEFGYYVDRKGNVYNRNKRKMTPQNHTGGYDKLSLWDRKTKTKQNRYIHRLVAQSFIDNPNNYRYVNHINGNKKDNRVENLEWCSAKENTNHAVKKGLIKSGELSSSSKLTQIEVDDNPENTCSSGLHVAAYNYASTFSSGHLLEVEVDPKDVVSVPNDYNGEKMRVCRYEVKKVCESRLDDVGLYEEEDLDFYDDLFDDATEEQ